MKTVHAYLFPDLQTLLHMRSDSDNAPLVYAQGMSYDGQGAAGTFPHPFTLQVTTSLEGPTLTQELKVTNMGSQPMPFTGALHTYYRLDVSKVCRPEVLLAGFALVHGGTTPSPCFCKSWQLVPEHREIASRLQLVQSSIKQHQTSFSCRNALPHPFQAWMPCLNEHKKNSMTTLTCFCLRLIELPRRALKD